MDSSDMLFLLVLYYLVGQCFVIAAPMRILRKAEHYTGLQMIGGAIIFLLAWPVPLLVSLVKLGRDRLVAGRRGKQITRLPRQRDISSLYNHTDHDRLV